MGIITLIPTYRYNGWTFEVHSYGGPWPLKKDGELRKRAGKKFYAMYLEFTQLSYEDQRKCQLTKGGCFRF